MHAPFAFVIAAVLMGLSAASFAELGSRMPGERQRSCIRACSIWMRGQSRNTKPIKCDGTFGGSRALTGIIPTYRGLG
jgi:hypothetical protein